MDDHEVEDSVKSQTLRIDSNQTGKPRRNGRLRLGQSMALHLYTQMLTYQPKLFDNGA